MKKIVAVLLTAAALSSTAAYAAPKAKPVRTKAAQTQEARNKANALAFYQHKPQEAVSKYVGKTYIQHNPTVADGGQAFIDAFAPFLKEHPGSRAEVKRIAAEGDLVFMHVFSQTSAQDRDEAVVDIFRFDRNGKIVEHWDVIQAVPEKNASGHSVF
ncbi:nuclear transport factor 2 family protein [uncultured Neisseria sp.]|uniref:nuclear transport factor 2 family protein n=1 Tax=uncultured Neisseria sp. TaxID=237778 RepID=UPI002628175D|nr:nuclear transport factor 2 family protein [uncultured Neisseria sp.]